MPIGKDEKIRKIPRDKGKEWEADKGPIWPDCERGKWYIVLHERHKNRVGICVSQSETGFGHKFAQLLFPDETETIGVRTHDLKEVEKPEGVNIELPPLPKSDQVD